MQEPDDHVVERALRMLAQGRNVRDVERELRSLGISQSMAKMAIAIAKRELRYA